MASFASPPSEAQPLRQSTLAELPSRVARPTYAREMLRSAIVHFGVGGFHRAHQAVYLDEIAERRISSDWAEHGVGLLPGDRRAVISGTVAAAAVAR